MASLLPNGKQQYFDNAGKPLVGGKVYTYAAGTSTLKATYQDAAGTIPNTNPVVLDARGEALIYWAGANKMVLQDSLGNVIYTVDNVSEAAFSYRTSTTGSVIVPAGTTAQRDANPNVFPGYFRYNTDLNSFEGFYQATWVSFANAVNGVAVPDGGNILLKTVNGLGIVGSGDLPLKTVGGVSLNGAGDVPVQAPLVSGTNIKTVAGVSIVGSGDIPFRTVSGVSVQGSGDITIPSNSLYSHFNLGGF